MNLTLHQPRPSDYEALASWVPDAVACLRWAGPRILFPFPVSELPDLLVVPGGTSYFLAEGCGVPCGFGQHWVIVAGSVHLGRIIVSPAARGKGVGRALCELLIGEAVRCTGANAITLRVYRDNAVAVSLYSSLGFLPVEADSDKEAIFMRVGVNTSIERADSSCA